MKGTVLLSVKDLDTERSGIEVSVELEKVSSLDKMMVVKALLTALLANTEELALFNAMVSVDFWPDGRTLADSIVEKGVRNSEN